MATICNRDSSGLYSSRGYCNSILHLNKAHTNNGEILKDRVENDKVKVQDTIAIAETRLTHQEGEAKRTEQETANFRSHVGVQQDGYKKAEDGMPTGMLIPFRAVVSIL